MTIKNNKKSFIGVTSQEILIMKIRQIIIITCLIGLCSLSWADFLEESFSQGEIAANMTAFIPLESENNISLNNSTSNLTNR
jgi:hypothetical protein